MKQELSSAEGALAVVPVNPNVMVVREMNEMKHEIEEMKNNPTYENIENEMFETRQEHNGAIRDESTAWSRFYEERSKYHEEEREAQLRQEDVDRLRRERNEWREQYDELIAEWAEGGYENEEEEEAHEARSVMSEAMASIIDTGKSKISRKEADKVIVPNWPKIHEVEFWKSQVTSNIVAACGDLDHDAWIQWIAPTFRQSPDIDGVLANLGDQRFNSIGLKLASSLMSIAEWWGSGSRSPT